MRKSLKLKKEREETYAHHAVDAMLICYSQMGYESYRKLQSDFIDFETGEILDIEKWKHNMDDETYADILYQNKWLQIKNNINDAEKKVKFWHKVDTKVNRGLCNQTIRGTREINGRIYKINKLSIYDSNGYKTFKKMIDGGKQEKFLMYKNDRRTFEQLLTIFDEYSDGSDATNAFIEYEKETGDFPRKYSKKHNGPRITNLKYTDGIVGSCIDISHKYGFEKESRKVILESLNPYRADVYFNTNDQQYYIIGLKYSDFKFVEGRVQIDENAYARILIQEKMIEPGQNRESLKEKGYVFKFSLYKNDFILYEKKGQFFEERFLSRTKPKDRNYIETKPIDAPKFPGKARNQVGLSKTKLIRKIRVDILGNRYYCDSEKFELYVDNK
jgi:CRISPR-associated endonuclease Csn1